MSKATEWAVRKRDGRSEAFDARKIEGAVHKCLVAGLGRSAWDAEPVVREVSTAARRVLAAQKKAEFDIEEVQRTIIQMLWSKGEYEAAEHFTIYREQRRLARESRPVPPHIAAAISEDASRFSPIQYFMFLDKYARWIDRDGRRETWRECCDRVIGFFRSRPALSVVPPDTWDVLREEMFCLRASPAMRVVQMAGPALERCNSGAFNCTAVAVDALEAFDEALYLLMQGCGVGFSVESDFVDELPRIKKQSGKPAETFVIPDSTEGWCAAYRAGMLAWFNGRDVRYAYDMIRPEGSVLKTKGGRASGHLPLKRLLDHARAVVLSRQGKKLRPIDAHDIMCLTGDIVAVGGVRRAAMLSLSDLDDAEMRDAKSGAWWERAKWRSKANNSAAYDEPPSEGEFMAEWHALMKSGSGERGVFNRHGALRQIPKRRKKARFLLNPCSPGFATVLTQDGIRTFDDIGVGSVIWSGKRWTKVVAKVATGVKPVFRYETTAGTFVGTANHRVFSRGERCEAGSATEIDICVGPEKVGLEDHDEQAVVDGWVLGDGSRRREVHLYLGADDGVFHEQLADFVVRYRPGINAQAWEVRTTITSEELPRTFDRTVPDRFRYGTVQIVRSFLRGLYAANGSVCGGRVTLKSTSLVLIRQVREMLSSIGIASYYTTNQAATVKWRNGEYTGKVSYDLNITTDRDRFRRQIGFCHAHKAAALDEACAARAQRRKPTYDVVSVEPLGDMPVYDITVEAEEHSYWTGGLLVSNCGEILLRSGQMCNLSIAVARPDDTDKTLLAKVRTAAIFGTLQATLTDFKYLRPIWKQNCDEERLLGVDITGSLDCPLLRPSNPDRRDLLRRLCDEAVRTNEEWADRLGIPHSAAVTCVKPSGNSAQFFGCSSGLHPRWSRHQIRRMTVQRDTPLDRFLRSEGVPFVLSPYNDREVLFEFLPEPAPEGTPVRDDMSALDQFRNWLDWKECYTEHNPSASLYVKEGEWMRLGAEVFANFSRVGGLSFFPHDGGTYAAAPNEELTEEKYLERLASFPKIDWAKLVTFEDGDRTAQLAEPACAGGACEV